MEGGQQQGQRRSESIVDALEDFCLADLNRVDRLRNNLSKLLPNKSSYFLRWQVPSTSSISGCPAASTQTNKDLTPILNAFIKRIEAGTSRQPHILLAYSWIFYMALFSGGRYIRSRLRGAGLDFWNSNCQVKRDALDDYLTFWTFNGNEDGEDIKAEFKKRFNDVETVLTETEREEVVSESVCIMRTMPGIVEEIVGVVNGKSSRVKEKGLEDLSITQLLLKHALPMGMVQLLDALTKGIIALKGILV